MYSKYHIRFDTDVLKPCVNDIFFYEKGRAPFQLFKKGTWGVTNKRARRRAVQKRPRQNTA